MPPLGDDPPNEKPPDPIADPDPAAAFVSSFATSPSNPARTVSQAAHFFASPLFRTEQTSHFQLSLSTENIALRLSDFEDASFASTDAPLSPSSSSSSSDDSSPPKSQSTYQLRKSTSLIFPSLVIFFSVFRCSSSQYTVFKLSMSFWKSDAGIALFPPDNSWKAVWAFCLSSSRSALSSESMDKPSSSPSTNSVYQSMKAALVILPDPAGSIMAICLSHSSPWNPWPSSSLRFSNESTGRDPPFSSSMVSNTRAAHLPATERL
mmetsp:Transcript_13649/g.32986  ORF Transcript_13649/g.32986 Transcript_13649/m.32986 type:complete len:264 (+) Transcript_13649:406-1197(+)